MITFATLRTLPTSSITTAADDYNSAGAKLKTAACDYKTHVVRPVDAGHIWHGVGRGNAETVTQVEHLALATASARMRTVGKTLETLHAELAIAKKQLLAVIDDATTHDFDVDDTGKVTPGATHKSMPNGYSGGIDWVQETGYQEAAEYEAKMKLAVRRAQRADKACGQLLDTVIGGSFVTTTTAQPGVLAQARDAYQTARGGELYASLLEKLLRAAYTQDRYGADHKEYGTPDRILGVGKGLWDWGSGTVSDIIGLIGLIGLAASGDSNAQAALRAIPRSTWKQLSTAQGWEDFAKQAFDWNDLEEGRPGEFLGNNLPWFISFLGVTRSTRVLRATRWMIKNPHTGELLDVQKTAESVTEHSYQKHVVEKAEFPEVKTHAQLQKIVLDVMTHGTMRKLEGGRFAFWHKGTLVICNPHQHDGYLGSVYRPKEGSGILITNFINEPLVDAMTHRDCHGDSA